MGYKLHRFYEYEIEYFESDMLQGNTYLERYTASSREAALVQWHREFPDISTENIVRIKKIV